jgi:hypothetical protein
MFRSVSNLDFLVSKWHYDSPLQPLDYMTSSREISHRSLVSMHFSCAIQPSFETTIGQLCFYCLSKSMRARRASTTVLVSGPRPPTKKIWTSPLHRWCAGVVGFDFHFPDKEA